MRRLAPALVVLAALAARTARAEPLDMELSRLGPPDANVWVTLAGSTAMTGAQAARYARESRQRFAIVSSQLALAFSSALLHPASTTGHSGFAFDLELASVAVDSKAVGAAPPLGFTNQPWATDGTQPSDLLLPSIHFRKALPWSLEMGGRLIYLSQSSYFAAQGEGKWALNEGYEYVPDLAVRLAYTRLFGPKDWNLGATDLDFMVSKRWGVNGVTSFTPYLATRFTFVSASSDRIQYRAQGTSTSGAYDPVAASGTMASYPSFRAGLYRTTLGVRFTAYAVSLAGELTYFGGSSPSVTGYEGVKLPSSFGGAAKLGWEF